MATKEELDRLNIIVLAVMCERAAKSPYMDDETRSTLRELKRQATKLEIRDAPPPSDYKVHQQIQAERDALKAHMVELLSTLPPKAYEDKDRK